MASSKAEPGEPTESKYDQAVRALLKEKSKGLVVDEEAKAADKMDHQGQT